MIHQRSRKPNPFDRRAAHKAARYRRRDSQTTPSHAPEETGIDASTARIPTRATDTAPAKSTDKATQKAPREAMPQPEASAHGEQKPGGRTTQYFAGDPLAEDVRRILTVTLRGRDVPMEVSNGVFSTDRLDLGTRVLLRHAPQPPAHGTFLDLGCGWGPIAVALALESPHADVWAVDVNERALDLTRSNAQRNGCANVHVSAADAVPQEVRFDLIWSNPPIRIGKEALHALLMQWLVRLAVGGRAYLVVQRNLGSDSLIPWLQQALDERCGEQSFEVSKDASSKGYRVIAVVRAR